MKVFQESELPGTRFINSETRHPRELHNISMSAVPANPRPPTISQIEAGLCRFVNAVDERF
ncbi:MAG TPA: hypothetical protein VK308_03995 [Pyrinomonadaceae bacterium]|nr:hypothetical protein [Pyrinomonadaceae bacterium]